jgi:hypothetical protein
LITLIFGVNFLFRFETFLVTLMACEVESANFLLMSKSLVLLFIDFMDGDGEGLRVPG